jgi:hypothetical protein
MACSTAIDCPGPGAYKARMASGLPSATIIT